MIYFRGIDEAGFFEQLAQSIRGAVSGVKEMTDRARKPAPRRDEIEQVKRAASFEDAANITQSR